MHNITLRKHYVSTDACERHGIYCSFTFLVCFLMESFGGDFGTF